MLGRAWMLIAGVVLGVAITFPLTAFASDWPTPFTGNAQMADLMLNRSDASSHTPTTPGQQVEESQVEVSEAHRQMHQMMDTTMGEGFSESMHEAMPGSEEMMELCAQHMAEMGGMMGMMHSGMGRGMMGDGGMMGMMKGNR